MDGLGSTEHYGIGESAKSKARRKEQLMPSVASWTAIAFRKKWLG
jgi:hypothetical protein